MVKQKSKSQKYYIRILEISGFPLPPTRIYPLKMTHLTENMDCSRSLPICRPDWCWNQASSLNATLIITTSTWQKNRARSTGPEEQWLITQKESARVGSLFDFITRTIFILLPESEEDGCGGIAGDWGSQARNVAVRQPVTAAQIASFVNRGARWWGWLDRA